jgi:hypothetical protein
MKLLLTMGPGLTPGPHGDIVVLDWERREAIDRFRYRHQVFAESHKGFAGASWHGDRLLAVTEVQILELAAAPLRLLREKSLPFLNDAHHACVKENSIYLANSGLDTVEELDREFNHKATHHLVPRHAKDWRRIGELLGEDLKRWLKRKAGRITFYTHLPHRPAFRNLRKLLFPRSFRESGEDLRFHDFRPHALHPNHVLPVNGDVWVTLWRHGRIVSLKSGEVIAEGLGRPHDGVISGEEFYATDCHTNRLFVYRFDGSRQTIGELLAVVPVTGKVEEGFLRGVAADQHHVYVGLSARRGIEAHDTARVRALKKWSWEPAGEWVAPYELGRQIFSVLDASDKY